MSARSMFVTGAASGIGLGIASHFGSRGWSVIAADRDGAALAAAVEPLRAAGQRIEARTLDVTDQGAIDSLAGELGAVDVLVNNAGVQYVSRLEEFPPDAWRRLIDVMLVGPAMLARAVLPGMRRRNSGRIVNMGSIHSLVASPYKSAYVSAKHGLVGLTRTLALETADCEITVNAICPGYVLTPLVEAQVAAQAKEHGLPPQRVVEEIMLAPAPKKRFIGIDELAAAVDYLVSDAARNVTGQCLVIDGGWTAR